MKNVSTGHLDCCGKMIRRGDKVVTVSGEATILHVQNRWLLWYGGRHLEPLNCYDASRLRRVEKGWDNKTLSRDNKILSLVLSRVLSQG